MEKAPIIVRVRTEDRSWIKTWPNRQRDVKNVVYAVLNTGELSKVAAHSEVTLVFSSDAKVRLLNLRFRGQDQPTNVLAFPDSNQPLGGVILARETVVAESKAQGKPFVNHAKHLVLHGFLHLLGYDHKTLHEQRLMESLEQRILAAMGIPNPYESNRVAQADLHHR
jgi:probable rRNA maturation factor